MVVALSVRVCFSIPLVEFNSLYGDTFDGHVLSPSVIHTAGDK